jgi:outer membrane protein assembly factor BamB
MRIIVTGIVVAVLATTAAQAQWESWRGPQSNGVSTETGFIDSWSVGGENHLWTQPFPGRSTPVVHDGLVFILARGSSGLTSHERVVAFDAETGKVAWSDSFNVFHTTIPGARVGWSSPCVDPSTGNVYVHGVQGLFRCYSHDGKLIWSRSLTEEQGRISGYGGRTHTPVVDEDLVILSFLNSGLGKQGKGSHRYVAFDKRTGEFIWWSQPGGQPFDTTYSTPVVTVIDGIRLLICGAADGHIYALKVRTGEKVWGVKLTKRGFNVSPVVDGHRVFIAHSEENVDSNQMGAVVCIDARAKPDATGDIGATGLLWKISGMTAGYASPLIKDGILYVVTNSGTLIAIDSKTGSQLWEHNLGTVGKGSPVWVDGKIVVTEVNGHIHILKPSRESCQSLSTVKFSREDGHAVEIFGSPAIANGRAYFCSTESTYCIGKKNWKGTTAPVPALAAEFDPTLAWIRVEPAEKLISAGDSIDFRVVGFNSRGQLLEELKNDVKWALKGLNGSIGGIGRFTSSGTGFEFGLVEASVGGLTATSRVRVVPPIPFAADFEGMNPKTLPTGWIGMSPMKFRVVEKDGSSVLMKHGTHFKLPFQRARVFMGAAGWNNYTIQADMNGHVRRRKLPDMGLFNQRYELHILGHRKKAKRTLRIVSWVADRRIYEVVPFEWDNEKWYTVKFCVEAKGAKALVSGKVWLREQAEPSDWTITVEDPMPNLEGSPGIYAYSPDTTSTKPGADVYFDNIKIYENK